MINKIKFLLIRVVVPGMLRVSFYFFPRNQKKLLIIKADGIGDYILFRNYLTFIKNSDRYKDHRLYVLANPAFRDLALFLDGEIADGFFWYSDSYFLKWQLIRLLFSLHLLRPRTIIYPNYSRKETTDWVVAQLHAKYKIGISGNDTNSPRQVLEKTDAYYTSLIDTGHQPVHEFQKNRQICEAITGETCAFTQPFFEPDKLVITKGNYMVLFPGASSSEKKWPLFNFQELCHLLLADADADIVVAGGSAEISDGQLLRELVGSDRLHDQTGKLSLIQLCELIGGARLLITNDTVAVHLAAALNIPAVCISKGDYYGRFIPYPAEVSPNITGVFPEAFREKESAYYCPSEYGVDAVPVVAVHHLISELKAGEQR